jgi:hypothetical protein
MLRENAAQERSVENLVQWFFRRGDDVADTHKAITEDDVRTEQSGFTRAGVGCPDQQRRRDAPIGAAADATP